MSKGIITKKISIDILEKYLGKKIYTICEVENEDSILGCHLKEGINVCFIITPNKDEAEKFIKDSELFHFYNVKTREFDFNDYGLLTEMAGPLLDDSVFYVIGEGMVDIFELIFFRKDVINKLTDKFTTNLKKSLRTPLLYLISDTKGKPLSYRIGNYQTTLALCTDIKFVNPEKYNQLHGCDASGLSQGAIIDAFMYSVDGSLVSGIEINTAFSIAFLTAVIEANSDKQIETLLNEKGMYS